MPSQLTMNVAGSIQRSAYSAALGAIQESQSRMLNAVQTLGSKGLDSLVDVQLDAMRAKTSQAANLKVIDALNEAEGYLLDIFA